MSCTLGRVSRAPRSPRPEGSARSPTLPGVSDQGEPDLETLAPAEPDGSPHVAPLDGAEPGGRGRGPLGAVLTGLVVVALVVGFGVTTIVLDAGDSAKSDPSASVAPTAPANPGARSPSIKP